MMTGTMVRKTIRGLLVLATTMAFSASLGREECEAMMKGNAYRGEWKEVRGQESLQLWFSTNALGVFRYQMTTFRFGWKSDGKGEIRIKPVDVEGAPELAPILYDAESNTMNLGRENLKSGLGFMGRLAYAGEKYPDWVETWLSRPLPRPRQALESAQVRLERLKREKPWGFRRVDSLLEELDPSRRLESKTWIKTVDGEYPRIDTPEDFMMADRIWFYFIYGRYEANSESEHVEMEYERRSRAQRPTDPPWQIGVAVEQMGAVFEKLEAEGFYFKKIAFDFGEGNNYWREDAIYVSARNRNQRKRLKELLGESIPELTNTPRYLLEKRVKEFFSKDAKKMYDIKWESGKPVLVQQKH